MCPVYIKKKNVFSTFFHWSAVTQGRISNFIARNSISQNVFIFHVFSDGKLDFTRNFDSNTDGIIIVVAIPIDVYCALCAGNL